jgi:hypothetical protein
MEINNLRVAYVGIHSIEHNPDKYMLFVELRDPDIPDESISFNRTGRIEHEIDRWGRESLMWRPDMLLWDEIESELMDAAEKAGLINTKLFVRELKKGEPAHWAYKDQPIVSNAELRCILKNLGALSPKFCMPYDRTLPECRTCQGIPSGNMRLAKYLELPDSSKKV